ncbi:MAG: glycosyl transferase family 2 [Planctomycetota bacterium]|nr:MAG: glycosyl transferase family 2 [Planctomycetota bacterium]
MTHLTLIIPLFNRPNTLSRILRALDAQTLASSRFETIFVDDSGPESYPIQESVLNSSPPKYRWTLLNTGLPRDVNGVSVARNKAIRAARGSVIVFMDDDCVPNPHLLEEHLKAHDADPDLAAVGNRSEDEKILSLAPPIPILRDKCAREAAKSAKGELGPGSFVTANASAKTKHLLAAGLFDESFAKRGEYGYEDRDLGARLLKAGAKLRFLPDAAVWIAPKESDPWAGKREQAQAAARARYHQKHDGALKKAVRKLFGKKK